MLRFRPVIHHNKSQFAVPFPNPDLKARLFMASTMFLAVAVGYATVALAADDWVDLVRIEDGKFSREVIYQLRNNSWQPPISLTKGSRTDDFTPVAIRTAQNQTLLLWKESIGLDASRLRFCLISFNADGDVARVGNTQTVPTATAHQSSPTLLRENSGDIWGFWVGLQGKDDEIFYARFQNGQWSAEKRLYSEDNDVPDLRPSSRINIRGEVELRWRRFSFEKGDYIDVASFVQSIRPDGEVVWSKPQSYVVNPLEKAPSLPKGFILPENIGLPDSVALHFASQPNYVIHMNNLQVEEAGNLGD